MSITECMYMLYGNKIEVRLYKVNDHDYLQISTTCKVTLLLNTKLANGTFLCWMFFYNSVTAFPRLRIHFFRHFIVLLWNYWNFSKVFHFPQQVVGIRLKLHFQLLYNFFQYMYIFIVFCLFMHICGLSTWIQMKSFRKINCIRNGTLNIYFQTN